MRQVKDRSVYINMQTRITVKVGGKYSIPDEVKSRIAEAINTAQYHMLQYGFIYSHNKAVVHSDTHEIVLEGMLERVMTVKAGTYKAAELRAVQLAQQQFSTIHACHICAENSLLEIEALRELAS